MLLEKCKEMPYGKEITKKNYHLHVETMLNHFKNLRSAFKTEKKLQKEEEPFEYNDLGDPIAKCSINNEKHEKNNLPDFLHFAPPSFQISTEKGGLRMKCLEDLKKKFGGEKNESDKEEEEQEDKDENDFVNEDNVFYEEKNQTSTPKTNFSFVENKKQKNEEKNEIFDDIDDKFVLPPSSPLLSDEQLKISVPNENLNQIEMKEIYSEEILKSPPKNDENNQFFTQINSIKGDFDDYIDEEEQEIDSDSPSNTKKISKKKIKKNENFSDSQKILMMNFLEAGKDLPPPEKLKLEKMLLEGYYSAAREFLLSIRIDLSNLQLDDEVLDDNDIQDVKMNKYILDVSDVEKKRLIHKEDFKAEESRMKKRKKREQKKLELELKREKKRRWEERKNILEEEEDY